MANTKQHLFDKAMCLNLQLGKWGITRRVKTQKAAGDIGTVRSQLQAGAVVSGAAPEMVGANKRLLKSAQYAAIGTLDGEIREYVGARCFPSLFRSGIWLMPNALLGEVEDRLTAFHDQRATLVEAFCDQYPTIQGEAEALLGPMFDPTQYPPVDQVRAAFRMAWHFVSFAPAGQLKALNRNLWNREQAKLEENMKEAEQEIRAALRYAMKGLVDHFVDRVQADANGRKPRIHETLVTKFTQFLDTFAARNLTEDTELSNIVDRARALMDGVDPDMLRESDDLREAMAGAFTEMQPALDQLVVAAPHREILFEEPATDSAVA